MKKIKDDTVKWGIIGVGNVCEVKSAPAMYKTPNSQLVAVMRRNAEKAADFAQRHGVPKWYSDVDQLINDPDVNAIYIATPPHIHTELALKVAASGKPAYVEKPMATTHDECQTMVKAFKEAGLPLYVAYYRRALPNFLKIKELIEGGAIGEVRMVHIEMIKPLAPDIITHLKDNWRVDPETSGGGYFYDLASHQLDFLDFLLGPVQQAKGISINQSGTYPADDITVGSFVFPDNVIGSGNWCFTAGNSIDREITTITGSRGHITYSTFENSTVNLFSDESGEQQYHFEPPAHIQQPLIEQIVADLLGKGDSPSTGESAARTNWVMDCITK